MKYRLALALVFAVSGILSVSGCLDTAQFLTNTATELSSSTPAQVTTYAEATQAAKLLTDAVDLLVNTSHLDKDTLTEFALINDTVHDAWLKLKDDKDHGRSLTFGAINGALDLYRTYATSKGVKH